MKNVLLIILSSSAAVLLFAVQTELIIFNHAKERYVPEKKHKTVACTLYWNDNELQSETIQLVQSDDQQKNLLHIINSWLSFLHSENVCKKIHAETVMLSPSGNELFISFDRNPFSKQQSIAEKLSFIEHLRKTIKPYTAAGKMRLLMHHAPVEDPHLDFIQGWNI